MSDRAVQIEKVIGNGMISLRGDFMTSTFATALESATGCPLPSQRKITAFEDKRAAWMSPDEILIVLPVETLATTIQALQHALDGTHHQIVDVSDMRCIFAVRGQFAREVISKGAPVDLSPDQFGIGDFRRTRLGQVAVGFFLADATTFHLMCFRSVSDFVFDWLNCVSREDSFPNYLIS